MCDDRATGAGATGELAPATSELRCTGVPADPGRFPGLRRALAGWAEHVGMSAEQIEALALASYEALANVAAHAYPDGDGLLDVRAVHTPGRAEVTVTDHGTWRPSDGGPTACGGRGLLLIDSLAEEAEITSAAGGGTSVRMAWAVDSEQPATR